MHERTKVAAIATPVLNKDAIAMDADAEPAAIVAMAADTGATAITSHAWHAVLNDRALTIMSHTAVFANAIAVPRTSDEVRRLRAASNALGVLASVLCI